jgi:hypothetical protein
MSQIPIPPTDERVWQLHLLPPHIDLDHVARYNSRGKALVGLIEEHDVSSLHHPAILGLFAVYSILVTLGYFQNEEISWPPHEDFAHEEWLDLGFTQEVVGILALLPYQKPPFNRRDMLKSIAPSAPEFGYLGNGSAMALGFDVEPWVLPEHFGITRMAATGFWYVYNTKDGKSLLLQPSPIRLTSQGTMMIVNEWNILLPEYKKQPWHPAELIMGNWVKNLYDLVYIATPSSSDVEAQHPVEIDETTGDQKPMSDAMLLSWAYADWPVDQLPRQSHHRVGLQRIRAIRNIYFSHGWPDQFDRDACMKALKRFCKHFDELEDTIRRVTPMEASLIYGSPIALPLEAVQARKELDEFLIIAAGPLALCPPEL